MRVLVVPEDSRKDKFILKPLFETLFRSIGKPKTYQRGVSNLPGGGRKPLGEEAAQRITAIRQKCPDDFDHLARRLEAAVTP